MDRDWYNDIIRGLGGLEFDGLEPADVFDLMFHLHNPVKSPMVLNASTDKHLIEGVKFYRDTVTFLETIAEHQPVKLTAKGNLPLAMCDLLIQRGLVGDSERLWGDWPVRSELDRPYLHIVNVVAGLAGLTRKQHGKLTVTKACLGELEKGVAVKIYMRLFKAYLRRLDWSYEDWGTGERLIQSLAGYSIYLVNKYGAETRPTRFYSDAFLKAMPCARPAIAGSDSTLADDGFWRAYSLHTFDRFLRRFGLVDVERDHERNPTTETVRRAKLFDDLITFRRGSSASAVHAPPRTPRKAGHGHVLQFKVTLKDTKPPVWRRIQVPGNYSFWDLHVAIQDAMGWTDHHLHEFLIHNPNTGIETMIGLPDEESELGERTLPGWKHKIAGWFTRENPMADYSYDFGDGWEHRVEFEGALPRGKDTAYPVCLDGERACPPEDVGGVDGYAEFLRAIRDPSHERHRELLEWAGGEFNPESFRPEDVVFDDPEDRKELMLSGL